MGKKRDKMRTIVPIRAQFGGAPVYSPNLDQPLRPRCQSAKMATGRRDSILWGKVMRSAVFLVVVSVVPFFAQAKPPVVLKPLTDMTTEDRNKGQDGGLYGGGKNQPPEKHLQAAIQQAKRIQPLASDGKPVPDGKIGSISVGMSNTTQEFSRFVPLGNSDPTKTSQVVIVQPDLCGYATTELNPEPYASKTRLRGSQS
jgi:hypothetical protein